MRVRVPPRAPNITLNAPEPPKGGAAMTMLQSPTGLLAAEVRFVEEGHRVRIDTDRHVFLVKSDTSDRTYELVATAQAGLLRVSCTCPAGRHARTNAALPCKHSLGVCEKLELHGLARFDGQRWLA